LKKLVPMKRSNISSTSATVITGKAKIMRKLVTSTIQTKTGMRMSDRPGARMFRMVTMKLKAAASEATPRICSESIQKSTARPGE